MLFFCAPWRGLRERPWFGAPFLFESPRHGETVDLRSAGDDPVPVTLRCPRCQKALSVPRKKLAEQIKCPACMEFFIPRPKSPVASRTHSANHEAIGTEVAAAATDVAVSAKPPVATNAPSTQPPPTGKSVGTASCPHCNTTLKDDGRLSGRQVLCPCCQHQFQMPGSLSLSGDSVARLGAGPAPEESSDQQYYIRLTDEPIGPLSASELQDLAGRGCVTPLTPVSTDGVAWRHYAAIFQSPTAAPSGPALAPSMAAAPTAALPGFQTYGVASAPSAGSQKRPFVVPLWAVELVAAIAALVVGLLAIGCIHLAEGAIPKRFLRPVQYGSFAVVMAAFAFVRSMLLSSQSGKFRTPLAAALEAVVLTPDGRHAVTLGADRFLRLWDVASGREVSAFTELPHAGRALDYSPPTQSIWCGGSDGLIYVFHSSDASRNRTINLTSNEWRFRSLSPITCVATSIDGRRAAAGCEDGVIRLLDLLHGERVVRLDGIKGRVGGIAFAADCRSLVAGGKDGLLRRWDCETGALLQSLSAHQDRITCVASLPGGLFVLSGGVGAIRLWDFTSSSLLSTLEGHSGEVTCLAVNPNGQFAASGGKDGSVRLWDLARSIQVACFQGHRGAVTGVALSPDGCTIVSCSRDRTIRSWQASI